MERVTRRSIRGLRRLGGFGYGFTKGTWGTSGGHLPIATVPEPRRSRGVTRGRPPEESPREQTSERLSSGVSHVSRPAATRAASGALRLRRNPRNPVIRDYIARRGGEQHTLMGIQVSMTCDINVAAMCMADVQIKS